MDRRAACSLRAAAGEGLRADGHTPRFAVLEPNLLLRLGSVNEGAGETLEPLLQGLVANGEAEPDPARAARAEALSRRDREAVFGEEALRGHPLGELQPDVERALA